MRLLLHDDCALADAAALGNIAYLQTDQVTSAQFAVDGKIE